MDNHLQRSMEILGGPSSSDRFRIEHVMGMPVIVDVRDDEVPHGALDDVFAWLRHVDATFSVYKADSEISHINRGELTEAEASAEVRAVLVRCEELRIETGGYFDVRAASPQSLDPSGLVKGWAVDRAAEILERAGLRNFAVNAGGDMRLRGRAAPAWSWRVGIQHPLHPDAVTRVIETNELAVATSGEYERGQHVLDPHTRRPPGGILSVRSWGPTSPPLTRMRRRPSRWAPQAQSAGQRASGATTR